MIVKKRNRHTATGLLVCAVACAMAFGQLLSAGGTAAQLDCRLLPDQDPQAFIEQLSVIINDPAIDIEVIMGFTPAVSTTDTELYRAIETVTARHFPNSKVVPAVSRTGRILTAPAWTSASFKASPCFLA